MAKIAKKEEQREKNELFMQELRGGEGIKELPGNVLYRVEAQGDGARCPNEASVVTVHYRGSLINGREFDNSRKRGCPEAFRVNGLIEGFRTALLNMHTGDRWTVYIPWEQGYGKRSSGPIPAYSTLIFDIIQLILHLCGKGNVHYIAKIFAEHIGNLICNLGRLNILTLFRRVFSL